MKAEEQNEIERLSSVSKERHVIQSFIDYVEHENKQNNCMYDNMEDYLIWLKEGRRRVLNAIA